MSKNLLKVVSDGMTELGLEYEFGEYTKEPIVYPYFVGEYLKQSRQQGLLARNNLHVVRVQP